MDQLKLIQDHCAKMQSMDVSNQLQEHLIKATKISIDSSFKLPITESNEFLIILVSIANDKKNSKFEHVYFNLFCNAILAGAFNGKALADFFDLYHNLSEKISTQKILNLNQLSTTIIQRLIKLNDILAIKSIFGLLFSLLINDDYVSSISFASLEIILSILFENIKTQKIFKFFTIFLSELSVLIKNPENHFKFLSISHKIPQKILFDLWIFILTHNQEQLKKYPILLKAISLSLSYDKQHFQVLLEFARIFSDVLPDQCFSIISYFQTSLINDLKNPSLLPILFFRNFIFSYPEFPSLYLSLSCNDTKSLQILFSAFSSILSFSSSMKHQIKISLNQIKDEQIHDPFFIQSSIIEIFLLISFQSDQKLAFDSISDSLGKIMIYSIYLTNLVSLKSIFNKVESYIRFAILFNSTSSIESCIIIFSSIIANFPISKSEICQEEQLINNLFITNENTQLNSFEKEVNQIVSGLAYFLIVSIMSDHGNVFSAYFRRVIISLGLYIERHQNAKSILKANFSIKLTDENLVKLATELMKGPEFPIEFLKEVIILNTNRINLLIPIIKEQFHQVLIDPLTHKAAISLIHSIMVEISNHPENNSIEIINAAFYFFTSIITEKSTNDSFKSRLMFLRLIHSILEQLNFDLFLAISKEELSQLIFSLMPMKSLSTTNEKEINSINREAFKDLNIIFKKVIQNNDIIYPLIDTFINSFFEYAFQKIDWKISFRALSLIPQILEIINSRTGNEQIIKTVFSKLFDFYNDTRKEITKKALDLIFSNIMVQLKNHKMSNELKAFTIEECFIPLIMSMNDLDNLSSDKIEITELILLGGCLIGYKFWEEMEIIPKFTSHFWPLLIDKQQMLLKRNDVKDNLVAESALKFYLNSLSCRKMNKELSESLSHSFTIFYRQLLPYFPELAYNCLVNLIPIRLPILILSNSQSVFDWFLIVTESCSNLSQDQVIQILSLIYSIIENENGNAKENDNIMKKYHEEMIIKLINSIVEIAKKYPKSIGVLINLFNSIDNIIKEMTFVIECSPLFSPQFQTSPEMNQLIQLITKKNFSFDDFDNHNHEEILSSFFKTIQNASKTYPILKQLLIRLLKMNDGLIEKIEDPDFLIEMWKLLCDPYEKDFNNKIGQKFAKNIVKQFKVLLQSNSNEEKLKMLKFAYDAHVPRIEFTNASNERWHLASFLGITLQLLDSPQSEIRNISRKIVEEVYQMLL